jgi:hypothetical protein
MGLRSLLGNLPAQIAHLSSAYVVAAREHEALAPYPTLAPLLDALGPPGKRSTPERKALIALLVQVHQTRPHTVWSTLLLHVFTPTVKKLRKELHGGDVDTRDGVLVEVFQELLLRVRADDPARIFLYVRQALRRGAFRAMKEVFAWQQVGFGTEPDLEADPTTEIEPALIGVWLKGHGTRPEQAELLATLVDHGGLQALVDRRHGSLDEAGKARAFRRLQKQRQRLVRALRQELQAEAPEAAVSSAGRPPSNARKRPTHFSEESVSPFGSRNASIQVGGCEATSERRAPEWPGRSDATRAPAAFAGQRSAHA